jgi:RND family efflux transporter MFP subunit
MTRLWIGILGLALAGCSGGADEADSNPTPVALVGLAKVESGAMSRQVTIYGTAEAGPGGKLSLVAPAEAILVAVDAPAGTRVSAGQVVARLAPSPTTRVDLAKAASDAQAADAALARAIRLRGDGLVSDAEVETARAAAKTADATRASMAQRAGSLTLRASSAGIVDTVTPAVGDLLQPGAMVATVTRQADLRGRLGVDPAMAATLQPGTAVHIDPADGRPPFAAAIQSVNRNVDPQTRLATIFIAIPAMTGIGAGQPLSAALDIGSNGAALTVPYAALLDDGGQAYVYVVAGGVAHRHDVTVGATSGDRVSVLKGITAGDMVVTTGGTALEDGMKVRTK